MQAQSFLKEVISSHVQRPALQYNGVHTAESPRRIHAANLNVRDFGGYPSYISSCSCTRKSFLFGSFDPANETNHFLEKFRVHNNIEKIFHLTDQDPSGFVCEQGTTVFSLTRKATRPNSNSVSGETSHETEVIVLLHRNQPAQLTKSAFHGIILGYSRRDTPCTTRHNTPFTDESQREYPNTMLL